MSMDAAAIDLSRAFEYGQGYVALSRVRSLEGLHLLGWSEQALVVHPLVVARDEDFREESEEAERAFGALDASGERLTLEQQFVKSSGGEWEAEGTEPGERLTKARKPAKASTYDETQKLIEEGKSFEEIAQERGLTFATVSGHAEKLLQAGKIQAEAVRAALSGALEAELPRIHDAFRSTGGTHLAPAYELLGGAFTYDELRLARLLYEG